MKDKTRLENRGYELVCEYYDYSLERDIEVYQKDKEYRYVDAKTGMTV